MARPKATFTQDAVTRAIKGVLAAEQDVRGVKVGPDGTIVVLTGQDNVLKTNQLEKDLAEKGL